MQFYVYMLLCADGSFYSGHTDDLETRYIAHQRGYGGYTSKRRPVRLAYHDVFTTRDEAFRAERQIKGWSRAKKQALIREDWEEIEGLAARQRPFTKK